MRDKLAALAGVDPDRLDLDAPLGDMGDSLEFVELVMQLEEEFDVNIPEAVAQRFRTLADIIRWLRDQQEKPQ